MGRQLSLKLGYVGARQYEPSQAAQSGAASFMAARGGSHDPTLGQEVTVNHHRAWRTALAHEQALGKNSVSDRLAASYDIMREDTQAQFAHMTRPKEQGGMGLSFEATDTDPYDSPQAMRNDVEGGRIKVLATRTTGSHTIFSDEENDQFRAVHDVFGHAAIGRSFSRHGEEGAYQAHAQMYRPEARLALASETRGQNSYLNYSGKGEFPPQQPVELPNWATDNREVPGMTRKQMGLGPRGRKEHFEQMTLGV